MLTIKKRGLNIKALSVIAATVFLTACGPAGPRALEKGERLVAAGKISEAVPKLEEAVRLLKDAPPATQADAFNWLGLAYHQAGRLNEARGAYQKARALDKNLGAAAYNLGCLLSDQGEYRSAVDCLNTSFQLTRPAEIPDADIYLHLGSTYLRWATHLAGADRNHCLDDARRYLDAANTRSPSADAANGLGMIQLHRYRSPHNAISQFKEALRLQPDYPPAILNMAIVHQYYLNDFRSAVEEYRTYLNLKPAPANAKEVEAALMALERQLATPANTVPAAAGSGGPAATSKPTNSVVVPKPAAKSETNGVTETPAAKVVREEPRNTTETAPKISPTTNSASLVASGSPASEPNTAPRITRIPDKSQTNSPAAVGPRYRYSSIPKPTPGNRAEAEKAITQGNQAQQKGNFVDAIAAYRNAVKADPASFDAYYRMGNAAQQSGDLPLALESFECALSARPDSTEARYAFAWTLQRAKFSQDAADELVKLIGQSPNDSRAHLLLGNLYAQQLNQPKLAREHFLKVLELEPQHAQAAAIRSWLTANP